MIIDDVRYKKVYDESEGNANKVNEVDWTAKTIIESLPKRLKQGKVGDSKFTFNFDVSGNNGGEFTVEIANGSCSVKEGLSDEAECTVSAEDSVYADVELGKINPQTAVMSGQLKISNLMAMMSFSKLFERVN